MIRAIFVPLDTRIRCREVHLTEHRWTDQIGEVLGFMPHRHEPESDTCLWPAYSDLKNERITAYMRELGLLRPSPVTGGEPIMAGDILVTGATDPERSLLYDVPTRFYKRFGVEGPPVTVRPRR